TGKSRGLLRQGDREVGELCHFINAEKATKIRPGGYSVALLCRTLRVSRSTCYSWLDARPGHQGRSRP
uniref:hypothetical protein n=1 Tax=Streptomyces sp. NRRL B-1347 TaxID=1476877 RepID=UPI001F3DFB73